MQEARRDFSLGDIPERVEQFAYTMALRSETSALVEYRRVLRVYTDLMLRGIIPDEHQRREPPSGSEGEEDSKSGRNGNVSTPTHYDNLTR